MMGIHLIIDNRMITEREISLIRDVDERSFIFEEGQAVRAKLNAEGKTRPIIGLFDGQIELFHQGSISNQEWWFQNYLKTLHRIADEHIILGGYVDSPMAGPVVRMLEFMLMSDNELTSARELHPLFGVHDIDLFDALLKPGERSAVFQLISSSSRFYGGQISLYFFYMKTGDSRNSSIARVEIPCYVAEDQRLINLLHHSINGDIQSTIPYPYCLLRAHEVAVISREMREELEGIIVSNLMKKGIVLSPLSAKLKAKKLLG